MPVLCASAKPMEANNKAELMGGGPENNMVTQALAIVEKKVRNLEKRKVRSCSLRESILQVLIRAEKLLLDVFGLGNLHWEIPSSFL